MDKIKLTVKQAITELNMSKSTLYNWMNDGKLDFQDSPRGRIITTTQAQINEIKELQNLTSSHMQESQILEASYEVHESPLKNTSTILESSGQSNTDIVLELTSKIAQISEKAGQVPLLVDNLAQNKMDSKYWQDKYFEIDSQYKKILEDLRESEKVHANLRLENERLSGIIKEKDDKLNKMKSKWWNKKLF